MPALEIVPRRLEVRPSSLGMPWVARGFDPPCGFSSRPDCCRHHWAARGSAQGAYQPSRVERLAYALRVEVLIVDGANVVGSRPDGWWRDRGAAARRLQERLSTAALPHDEVVLVLEGVARRGNPAGQDGRLHTVHAAGSGDDAIVEAAKAQVDIGDGRGVTVVTADRVLRDRVEAVGARSVGPSWLLDQLDSH